jgi:hypothetical protein
MSLAPLAQAAPISPPPVVTEMPRPVQGAPNCASITAFYKTNFPQGMPGVLPATQAFASDAAAVAYIKERMGSFNAPATFCLAEEPIRTIKAVKSTLPEIEKASNELIKLIQTDSLRHCEPRIMDLLAEFATTLNDRSLASMERLPDVLKALLHTKGQDFTFSQLTFLATTINKLSREMVPRYFSTNQDATCRRWIDLMLDSARDRETRLESMRTATGLLQGTTEEKFSPEQKAKIRKMARLFQVGTTSPQDLAAAQDLLKITGSNIRIMEFINSYLECLPDDIKNIEESMLAIARTIYNSSTLRGIALASIAGVVVLNPGRIKQALILLGCLYALKRYWG